MTPVRALVTPVRAPDVVRGDVLGLLCRGMPVLWRGESFTLTHQPPVVDECQDGWNCRSVTSERRLYPLYVTVDWSDRAAVLLCLAWLADRGYICIWMLPTTHGGRVEAWDGLTAWEVSAILVARSVVRVARGLGPVRTIDHAFRPVNVRMSLDHVGDASTVYNATDADRDYFIAPTRLGPGVKATPDHLGWMYTPLIGLSTYGMETGADAVAKINACALADGCALLVPSGILLPD